MQKKSSIFNLSSWADLWNIGRDSSRDTGSIASSSRHNSSYSSSGYSSLTRSSSLRDPRRNRQASDASSVASSFRTGSLRRDPRRNRQASDASSVASSFRTGSLRKDPRTVASVARSDHSIYTPLNAPLNDMASVASSRNTGSVYSVRKKAPNAHDMRAETLSSDHLNIHEVADTEKLESTMKLYFDTFIREAMVALDIPVYASQRPERLLPEQKKRHDLNTGVHNQLLKETLKTQTQLNSSLASQVFKKNGNVMPVSSSLSVAVMTAATAINPVIGAGVGLVTAILAIAYLTAEFHKAKQNKALTDKLKLYLPSENNQIHSEILEIISLLTVLVVKDRIDTELQLDQQKKLKFDPSRLLDVVNSLNKRSDEDLITSAWTGQERKIAQLAKSYAREIFNNLIDYACQERAGEINNKIFEILVPSFMQTNDSVRVTHNRVALTGWLAALSMKLSNNHTYPHDALLAYADMEKVRNRIDCKILQIEENDQAGQNLSDASDSLSQTSPLHTKVSRWLVDIENAPDQRSENSDNDSFYESTRSTTSHRSSASRSSSRAAFFRSDERPTAAQQASSETPTRTPRMGLMSSEV